MCTTARMTYQLTYRALREFNSGRKSVNPIEALHKMETCVPYSVCSKTHTVMMLAQRSFNQRYLAPVGVHETWLSHSTSLSDSTIILSEISVLRHKFYGFKIHALLLDARNRAYSRKATRKPSNLCRLEATERLVCTQIVGRKPVVSFVRIDNELWMTID